MKSARRCVVLLPAVLSAFFAGVAAAQDILPAGGFVRGWEADGPPRVFIEKDLFNHIDGGAELFLEFGFAKLRVQPYSGEKAELVGELYEMTGPAAALGIYLMNAGRETPWPEIPPEIPARTPRSSPSRVVSFSRSTISSRARPSARR